MPSQEDLVSIQDTARRIEKSVSYVYEAIKKKQLIATRVNHRVLVPLRSIDDWRSLHPQQLNLPFDGPRT